MKFCSENKRISFFRDYVAAFKAEEKRFLAATAIPLLLVFIGGLSSCSRNHLIRDASYLDRVKKDFATTKKLASRRAGELFDVFGGRLTQEEREGLMFLYAYMPLNDLADYDGAFFLDQVRYSLRAREEMSWGDSIPEEIFLHYVLPYRVNNENLDSFRMVYYDEIKARVEGLSLEQAALEINHWCHEKVAYQPADIRTSSPMNTVKNARGRCGEESTFTVAALRTAGIPARQVYVPRWAHTDDNHAWVEVWVHGRWHYLGACEPEPVLDLGWFTEPASRAMLVHTKAFGAYRGREPLVKNMPKYAEINCLHRYAVTKDAVVRVTDSEGRPVQGAVVDYRLYNYAEFFPLASLVTDSAGCTVLNTGLGDLLIWAHKGDLYGYEKMSVAVTDTLQVELQNHPGKEDVTELDLVPPPPRKFPSRLTPAQEEENALRLQHEDSIRLAYTATFYDSIGAAAWAAGHGYPADRIVPLLVKSMGNHATITAFLEKVEDPQKQLALLLLENVSDKDLRDVTEEVLQDHLDHAPPLQGTEEDYGRYLLSPRVANEQLTPYRAFFLKHFTQEEQNTFREDPEKVAAWINENIILDKKDNYYDVPITPPGVFALQLADRHSRKIFFTALCRTLGIPARLEPSRDVVQYRRGNKWQDVFLKGDPVLPGRTASLTLQTEKNGAVPRYYVRYTLGRYAEGVYTTMEFPFRMEATSFVNMPMDPGAYLLVTGQREEDGSVLARMQFFSLQEKEKKTVELKVRKSFLRPQVLGHISGDTDLKAWTGKGQRTLGGILRKEGAVLCWIDQRKEPSRHLINELPDILYALGSWEGKVVILVTGEEEKGTLDPGSLSLPPGKILFMEDPEGVLLQQVTETAGRAGEHPDRPVIAVVDGKRQITDFMEGYRIGLESRLARDVVRGE